MNLWQTDFLLIIPSQALKQMDNSIKNLEMDLQNNARAATDPDDKFAESMGQFSKGKNPTP